MKLAQLKASQQPLEQLQQRLPSSDHWPQYLLSLLPAAIRLPAQGDPLHSYAAELAAAAAAPACGLSQAQCKQILQLLQELMSAGVVPGQESSVMTVTTAALSAEAVSAGTECPDRLAASSSTRFGLRQGQQQLLQEHGGGNPLPVVAGASCNQVQVDVIMGEKQCLQEQQQQHPLEPVKEQPVSSAVQGEKYEQTPGQMEQQDGQSRGCGSMGGGDPVSHAAGVSAPCSHQSAPTARSGAGAIGVGDIPQLQENGIGSGLVAEGGVKGQDETVQKGGLKRELEQPQEQREMKQQCVEPKQGISRCSSPIERSQQPQEQDDGARVKLVAGVSTAANCSLPAAAAAATGSHGDQASGIQTMLASMKQQGKQQQGQQSQQQGQQPQQQQQQHNGMKQDLKEAMEQQQQNGLEEQQLDGLQREQHHGMQQQKGLQDQQLKDLQQEQQRQHKMEQQQQQKQQDVKQQDLQQQKTQEVTQQEFKERQQQQKAQEAKQQELKEQQQQKTQEVKQQGYQEQQQHKTQKVKQQGSKEQQQKPLEANQQELKQQQQHQKAMQQRVGREQQLDKDSKKHQQQDQRQKQEGQQHREGRQQLEQRPHQSSTQSMTFPEGNVTIATRPYNGVQAMFKILKARLLRKLPEEERDDLREVSLLLSFLYCCGRTLVDEPAAQKLMLQLVPLSLLQLPYALLDGWQREEELESLLKRRQGVLVRCNVGGEVRSQGKYVRLAPGYLQAVLGHGFLRERGAVVAQRLEEQLDRRLRLYNSSSRELEMEDLFTALTAFAEFKMYIEVRIAVYQGRLTGLGL